MSEIAALLIPAALPNSASALAATRNAAVAGKTFEATFAQFLTMLPALDADQVAPTAPNADSAKLLSVFGIAPQAPATRQTDALPGILSVPPLPDAAPSPQDPAAQGLALVGQVAAQLTSPPVTDPTKGLAAATAAPESRTQKPVSAPLAPPLRGSISDIDGQTSAPKPQPEAKTAPTTGAATPPAAPLALPKENTPQTPTAAKPQVSSKPAAAKGAPAAKNNGPETNSVSPRDKPVSQRHSETAVAPTPTAQTVIPTAQAQSNVAQSTPQAAAPAATAAAAPVLPAVVQVQEISSTVVAAPQAGVPVEALAVHIARKFESGSNQFEIRLHPAELGQLDISLTVADDGHVQAVLRADRPETLDMLQKDARALEQQLRQAGLEVGSNALSFSLSSGNGQRHAPFTGWPGFADAQGLAGAAKEEAAAKYIAVRVRDGVDIRV